ncbi:DUF1345 domain-containing protein [Microbacterium sp. NPDC091313]
MSQSDAAATASVNYSDRRHRAGWRVAVLFAITAVVTVAVGLLGSWAYAPAIGWIAGAGTYSVVVWTTIFRLDAAETSRHATREDPTRTTAHTLLILSSLASFGAIVLVLLESGSVADTRARFALAGIALVTVAASWFLVHVLFSLRYAKAYYAHGGGISFNQDEPPAYQDFAYLAFTLGMTYQVSDTDITSPIIRHEVLRHALLSFLLGVVVVAATINLVSSLVNT